MVSPEPETSTGVPLMTSDATLQDWLQEDLGAPPHDVTSEAIFGEDDTGAAHLVAREELVVSGLEEALRVFALTGAESGPTTQDGARVTAGTRLARIHGPILSILKAERLALNLLQHASAIASHTDELQKQLAAKNKDCKIAATRKTTPGLRALEKRAVVHGGGDPHRWGLWDMILLKDNHLAAGGELPALIKRLRQAHPGLILQVEVETRAQLEAAAREDVDWILIDNQGPDTVRGWSQHARTLDPGIRIEASGAITAQTAADYAPWVDRVSMGALTRSAPVKDIGLDWEA